MAEADSFLIDVWREAVPSTSSSRTPSRGSCRILAGACRSRASPCARSTSGGARSRRSRARRASAAAASTQRARRGGARRDPRLVPRRALEHASAERAARAAPGSAARPASTGDVLVGPLLSPEEPRGAARAGRAPRRALRRARTRPLARALLEPFAAALENDRRVRALAAVREAAEAERARAALAARPQRPRRDDRRRRGGPPPGDGARRARRAARRARCSSSARPARARRWSRARSTRARARAAGPFLRVNCGAIPPGLIDSELFGHERGSFTGALAERRGWFERADGGTLFLDEIGELPLDGAGAPAARAPGRHARARRRPPRRSTVDVRIVAATHRDLAGDGRGGPLPRGPLVPDRRLPDPAAAAARAAGGHPGAREPLRAARRDALRHAAAPARRRRTSSCCVAYPWPGNVRELIAVIERAVILGNGERLEVAKALGVRAGARAARAPRAARGRRAGAARARSRRSTAAMARHIEAALARTQRPDRGAARRGRAARHQPAHAARADAEARRGREPPPRALRASSSHTWKRWPERTKPAVSACRQAARHGWQMPWLLGRMSPTR